MFKRKELLCYCSVVSYAVHGGIGGNSCAGDIGEPVIRYDCPSLTRLAFYHETVNSTLIVLWIVLQIGPQPSETSVTISL
jgi:hypothetical protein